MFKKVNMINKLVSLFIFIIILIVLKINVLVFLPAILTLILVLTSFNKRNLFISLAFLLLSFFIPNILYLNVLYKALILLFFIFALENSLTADEKRNFYAYLNKSKFIDNKKIIDRCYKEDLSNTIEFENSLIYKYVSNKEEKKSYKNYLKHEKEKKLISETKYKYLLNKLRYGNFHDKIKETRYRFVWTNDDNTYIAIFIFGFLLSLLTRI